MVFGNFHYRNSNCTLFVTLLGVENRIKEKQVSDGGTNDMTRLTPEREADLRSIHEGNPATNPESDIGLCFPKALRNAQNCPQCGDECSWYSYIGFGTSWYNATYGRCKKCGSVNPVAVETVVIDAYLEGKEAK